MKELICIVCPKGCHLKVDEENGFAVTGNACPGAEYGKMELTHSHPGGDLHGAVRRGAVPPVPGQDGPARPQGGDLPGDGRIGGCGAVRPRPGGQVVVENVCGTGANVVATRDMI